MARRHEGRVAVDARNACWCSDGFEFSGGEKLRATSALGCCDCDAISWGCSGDYVRDVMLESIEKRFGGELPTSPVQGLRDNGSAYTSEQPWAFAWQIDLLPLTTAVCSPQSNCMAESFVKTMKRDYIRHMPQPD